MCRRSVNELSEFRLKGVGAPSADGGELPTRGRVSDWDEGLQMGEAPADAR